MLSILHFFEATVVVTVLLIAAFFAAGLGAELERETRRQAGDRR